MTDLDPRPSKDTKLILEGDLTEVIMGKGLKLLPSDKTDAVYKPYAIFDGQKWLLWYKGRRGGVEQIGLAIHQGVDLGF